MHVVWHDRPCVQVIAITIKEVQGPGHQISCFRPSQPTLARPGIQKRLHPLRIPNEQLLFLLPSQRTFGCHGTADDGFALLLQLEHRFTRQRIRKTESHEIRRAFTLQVRQLATKMEPGNQPVRIGFHSGRLHCTKGISQPGAIANPETAAWWRQPSWLPVNAASLLRFGKNDTPAGQLAAGCRSHWHAGKRAATIARRDGCFISTSHPRPWPGGICLPALPPKARRHIARLPCRCEPDSAPPMFRRRQNPISRR